MPVSELLSSGVQLMIVGMGVTFTFLGILIFTIGAMSKFAIAVGGNATPASGAGASASPQGIDDNLKTVITEAVHRYRKKHSS